jgi:hypothetical protein
MDEKRYLNLKHMSIVKNTLSGATLIKKFPPKWCRKNQKSNKANPKFCLCPDFTQHSIEVYQVSFGYPHVEKN